MQKCILHVNILKYGFKVFNELRFQSKDVHKNMCFIFI